MLDQGDCDTPWGLVQQGRRPPSACINGGVLNACALMDKRGRSARLVYITACCILSICSLSCVYSCNNKKKTGDWTES